MSNALKIPPVDRLLREAAQLSRPELLDLQSAINALAQATEPEVIDLDAERADRRPPPEKEKGSIELKKINGCGPYRYLRWREDGKRKSKYLGNLK